MMISPLDVEIKTLNLKNKKITKSIFNQIEFSSCFDSKLDFIGEKCFGYIKEKNKRYLIWTDGTKLRKTDLSIYTALNKLFANDKFLSENVEWFLQKTDVSYYCDDGADGRIHLELQGEQREIYNALLDKVRSFISDTMEHQLFY